MVNLIIPLFLIEVLVSITGRIDLRLLDEVEAEVDIFDRSR
jgi:hypothetical protein